MKNRKRALLGALASGTIVLGGCMDMGGVEAMRETAANARDQLAAEVEALENLRETFPDGTPEAIETDTLLAAGSAKVAAIEAAIARIDQTLAEANNPSDGLTLTAQGVSPLLPEPVRLPLVLGAALAATLLRAGQLKRGAVSMAKSINKALESDGELSQAFARHADTLRSIQTRTAQRIVDQVSGKTALPALPI
ncbi:MAG: hypothetical protein R3B57_05660 [Phycisphaerales bacterium]